MVSPVLGRESLEPNEILGETIPPEGAPSFLEEALGFGQLPRCRDLGAEHLLQPHAFGFPKPDRRPEAARILLNLSRHDPPTFGFCGPRRLEGLRPVPALLAEAVHGGERGVREELGFWSQLPGLAFGRAPFPERGRQRLLPPREGPTVCPCLGEGRSEEH